MRPMPTPVLHIANRNYSSWSLRPWVLMRELAIPFEERLVPFAPPDRPNPFLAFSPTGKVPCLVDDGVVVWDSLAIVERLAERRPDVWPRDPGARAWARSAAAEMHSGFPTLRDVCSMNCGVRVRLREVSPALARECARLDALWGEGLERFGGPFLAGSLFTAVDAFYAPVAFRVRTYSPPLAPRSLEYVERLLALPSMREWYEAGLAETWRDAAHEADLARAGTVVEDLRR
ncbi:MAG TPA: glutathione S-transferase family protein [Burkholderiaceae bacterium]|nr:glutathione S-transferase family protein [Burkholderiaceae bacterium]